MGCHTRFTKAEFKAACGSVKGQVGRRGGADGTEEVLNMRLEPSTGKASTGVMQTSTDPTGGELRTVPAIISVSKKDLSGL